MTLHVVDKCASVFFLLTAATIITLIALGAPCRLKRAVSTKRSIEQTQLAYTCDPVVSKSV